MISNNLNKLEESTLSTTEIAAQFYNDISLQTQVAATVYREIDLKTQIAATIFSQIAEANQTGNPDFQTTANPYQYLADLYPCLPENSPFIKANVIGIVDGDTINAVINGQAYSIHYIGIDCPENNPASIGVETNANKAAQSNRDLVDGKEVILVKDMSEVDDYGRQLRYVFVDNIFVNFKIIEQDMAYAVHYPPDIACSSYLATAQSQAKLANLGLWQPLANTVPTVSINSTTYDKEDCDPCYPTVCIPSYPPDLDCGEIPYKGFEVLQPDPHGFDGDNDGIVCES